MRYVYPTACHASLAAEVEAMLRAALTDLSSSGALPGQAEQFPFTVEKPRDPAHGEVATNVALSLAKVVGKAPRDLASLIVDVLEARLDQDSYIDAIEVAGPGFINFRTNARYLADVVCGIAKAPLGSRWAECRQPRSVLIEFVSANPTEIGRAHV